jgi:hypothetical protein
LPKKGERDGGLEAARHSTGAASPACTAAADWQVSNIYTIRRVGTATCTTDMSVAIVHAQREELVAPQSGVFAARQAVQGRGAAQGYGRRRPHWWRRTGHARHRAQLELAVWHARHHARPNACHVSLSQLRRCSHETQHRKTLLLGLSLVQGGAAALTEVGGVSPINRPTRPRGPRLALQNRASVRVAVSP